MDAGSEEEGELWKGSAAIGQLECFSVNPVFVAIDHVQLAMPAGREDAARRFYCGLLGMAEVQKPEALGDRGGCWFESGPVKIHLGVEEDFRPARKAHPALRLTDFDGLTEKLRAAGIDVREASDIPWLHVQDPFGNRIELVAAPADL